MLHSRDGSTLARLVRATWRPVFCACFVTPAQSGMRHNNERPVANGARGGRRGLLIKGALAVAVVAVLVYGWRVAVDYRERQAVARDYNLGLLYKGNHDRLPVCVRVCSVLHARTHFERKQLQTAWRANRATTRRRCSCSNPRQSSATCRRLVRG